VLFVVQEILLHTSVFPFSASYRGNIWQYYASSYFFPWWSWSGYMGEFRFKAPPGTSDSPLISTLFSSGKRNRAYWASQPQKSVILQPQRGRGDHEIWEDMWWHWGKRKVLSIGEIN